MYDKRGAQRKEAKIGRLGSCAAVTVAVVVAVAALKAVASTLMTLHVAANAEGLSATSMGALERLLAGV